MVSRIGETTVIAISGRSISSDTISVESTHCFLMVNELLLSMFVRVCSYSVAYKCML